jgi:hypothetical protein
MRSRQKLLELLLNQRLIAGRRREPSLSKLMRKHKPTSNGNQPQLRKPGTTGALDNVCQKIVPTYYSVFVLLQR